MEYKESTGDGRVGGVRVCTQDSSTVGRRVCAAFYASVFSTERQIKADKIATQIDDGLFTVGEFTFPYLDASEIPKIEARKMRGPGRDESDLHLSLKYSAGRFLESKGMTVTYEAGYVFGFCDVAASEGVYVECGNTDPGRCYAAFCYPIFIYVPFSTPEYGTCEGFIFTATDKGREWWRIQVEAAKVEERELQERIVKALCL